MTMTHRIDHNVISANSEDLEAGKLFSAPLKIAAAQGVSLGALGRNSNRREEPKGPNSDNTEISNVQSPRPKPNPERPFNVKIDRIGTSKR
jgi:hypothetical protein